MRGRRTFHGYAFVFSSQSLGQIGRHHPLTSDAATDVPALLIATLNRALGGQKLQAKLAEAAASALGLLGIGAYPHSQRQAIREALFTTPAAKLLELNMAVGLTLTQLAAGKVSNASVDLLQVSEDADGASPDAGVLTTEIEDVLQAIITDKAQSTRAADRQAATVWLASFISELGTTPAVQAALPRLQHMLLDALSEGDDVLQEIASQALSNCYDLGTPEMKQSLVASLVDALSAGHRSQVGGKDKGDVNHWGHHRLTVIFLPFLFPRPKNLPPPVRTKYSRPAKSARRAKARI